jgi:hypothetical protein
MKGGRAVRRSSQEKELMPSLYEQVVDCCGLAPDFARRIISQVCERNGFVADEMGPSDLIRVLPHIQHALEVFLDPGEVQRKVGAMRRLVRLALFRGGRPGNRSAPQTDRARVDS